MAFNPFGFFSQKEEEVLMNLEKTTTQDNIKSRTVITLVALIGFCIIAVILGYILLDFSM